MSIAKFRGKSALLHNNENNSNNKTTINKPSIAPPSSLLKIEPFVPTLTTRTRKPIHRSYSTLSTTYFKRVIDQKHRTGRHLERTVLSRQRSKSSLSSSSVSQNGVCHINRPSKEQERLPDRINYDRRGLTSIPIFENEQNLRLLSLQHNLINVFHIPDDSIRKQHNIIEEVEEIRLSRPTSLYQENENNNLINKAQQQRNGIVTKKSLAASPTITPAILTPPGTNTNNNNNINNINNNNNNNNNNGNLLKSTFVQKSVLLHANHKYSLKKSKSFMTSYSKHLNSIKQNLQKCTMTKVKNITALEAATHPQEITENKVPEKQETGIESLKVQNNQFSPHYGAIFQNLVFLDLYDNQIEKISNLDGLKSLTVLLLGKNRIIEISGLSSLKNTLRVLDLHGNKISSVSNKLNCLQELKSLNLAGNQIRQINQNDFAGLLNLKELNLKRNKIKRVYGFNHLSSLERLWLCHNDLHKVEDMSSIAKAINLQEVTIENNPVSLAGDCVSFLVSYLPNLMMLSQMPITDQVRRAAMAWRKNKEMSDTNYSSLTSDVFSSIRREEVISNARTNWELLRSQQVLTSNKSISTKLSPTPSLQKVTTDNEKTPSDAEQNNRNSTKIKITKINSDTNNKTNQNKLDDEIQDFFRLPPILKPFTSSAASSEKTHSSGSSLGPNIDSSSSCYSSDNEDKLEPLNNNDQPSPPRNQKQEQVAVQVPEVNEQPPFESEDVYYDIVPKDEFKEVMVIEDTAEISSNPNVNHQDEPLQQEQQQEQQQQQPKEESIPSNLDTNHKGNEANSNNDSNSQSDKNSNISTASLKSESEISAGILNPPEKSIKNRVPNNNIPAKRYMHGSLMRSQTAKPRTSTVSHNTVSNSIAPCNAVASKTSKPAGEREREQGGDYLIEICGRYLNIYGLGALRFIDKQWNTQKANDVHTLNFSYINFNNIATILGRIKVRFPNAESFVFRETNISSIGQLNALAELQGITALIIDPEGNSISTKEWRLYAVYRLSHWGLKTINGVEVTEKEVERAQKEYLGLSDLVLWSLPESMLQPLLTRLRLDETCSASKLSAKEWLMKADQSLKVVVGKEALQWKRTANSQEDYGLRERGKIHFSVMIENTCNAVEKLQKLETLWPSLLLDIVRNTLLDYSQLDVYLKNVMTEVMK